LPLLHPRRVAAVAGLSGPPAPRSRRPPTQIWRKAAGDNFFYILYFQQPGVADADLGRDPARTIRRVLAAPRVDRAQLADMQRPGPQGYVDRLPEPTELPRWLKQHELDYCIGEFSRTGFTGALNWYRNFDRNWELTADPPATTIAAPALFIAGSDDPVLSFTRTDRHGEMITGPYRQLIIDGAGHWIQQERHDEVNAALLDLLSTAF
jgi:pimeloyl-ACP methyl ester carboxylesterase